MTIESPERPAEPRAGEIFIRRTLGAGKLVGALFCAGSVIGLAAEAIEYAESETAITEINECVGDQDSFGGQIVIDLQQSDLSLKRRVSCMRMLDAGRDQRKLVAQYTVNLEAAELRRQQLEVDKPFQLDQGPKQWGLSISAAGTVFFMAISGLEKLTNRKKSQESDLSNESHLSE